MENESICVIGVSSIDLHINVQEKLKREESIPGKIQFRPGGVGRNIVSGLAALKVRASFISNFANSIFCDVLLHSMNEEYIDYTMSMFESKEVSFYCDLITENEMYGINDMKSIEELSIPFFESKISILNSMDYIVFDLNMNQSVFEYIVDHTNAKIVCDATSVLKCKKISNRFNHIFLLKANYYEALELAGNGEENLSCDILADRLLQKGIRQVYITIGEQGVFYASSQERMQVKRLETLKTQNTSGAGDVFLAAVLYGLMNQWDQIELLSFAVNLSFYYIAEGKYRVTEDVIRKANESKQDELSIHR